MYSILNACITVFNITLTIKMQYHKQRIERLLSTAKEFTETPKECNVSPKTLLEHH